MKPALTSKQRFFVERYLVHWNASRAAREAGYSARTAGQIGYELLKKPEIQDAITARLAEVTMGADEVLARLTRMARGSIADVIRLPSTTPPPDGHAPESCDAWALDLIKAQETGAIDLIKSIHETKYGPDIEMYSAKDALDSLAKHYGLFGDDGILKYLDLTKLNDEQLRRLANGDEPLAVLLNT